jgi:hypothetical protein
MVCRCAELVTLRRRTGRPRRAIAIFSSEHDWRPARAGQPPNGRLRKAHRQALGVMVGWLRQRNRTRECGTPSSSGPAATGTEGLNTRKVATRACLSVNVMVTLLWDLTAVSRRSPRLGLVTLRQTFVFRSHGARWMGGDLSAGIDCAWPPCRCVCCAEQATRRRGRARRPPPPFMKSKNQLRPLPEMPRIFSFRLQCGSEGAPCGRGHGLPRPVRPGGTPSLTGR